MTPSYILLLYKSSAYDYYRHLSRRIRLRSEELEHFRQTHTLHYQSLERVENALRVRGLSYRKVRRGRLQHYKAFDLVITVGGDGTFLEAARYVTNQPILGVNSDPAWSVGQLCSADANTFENFLDQILSGLRSVKRLNRLTVRLGRLDQEICFLNDILIAHVNPASLSRYILQIGNVSEEQRGSGIWIASATGSTSAIHSAGGVILPPESHEIQYMPRELYAGWHGQECHLKGGVLTPQERIRVTSLMAEGMIFIDGSHQRMMFGVSETADISQSEYPLNVF